MEVGGNVTIAPGATGRQSNLIVAGSLLVHSTGIFGSSVLTNGGYAAKTGAPFVSPLINAVPIEPAADALGNIIAQEVLAIGAVVTVHEDVAVSNEDSSPGNAEFQKRVGFSFRDTKLDLKIDQTTFILYESRWQQMLRAAGNDTVWDEPEVTAPTGEKTRPYPGQQGWQDYEAYGQVENNVNLVEDTGVAKTRTAMSEKGNKPTKKTLKSGYLINVQS
jgi:hypothetical protein